MTTSQFGKSWNGQKYKNLNTLRKKQFFYEIEKFLSFVSDDKFWEIIDL